MPIDFLFSRREALTGGSEVYKKSIRKYLEAEGYAQARDSIVEGSLEDMVFTHPDDPGRVTVVEAKAGALGVRTTSFGTSLVSYFRRWCRQSVEERFRFRVFVQEAKRATEWEGLFETPKSGARTWQEWYNSKCRVEEEPALEDDEMDDFTVFLEGTRVTVGSSLYLELAAREKEKMSTHSLVRMAERHLVTVNARRIPAPKKSTLVLNVARFTIPSSYYVARIRPEYEKEATELAERRLVPPFYWRRGGRFMTFVPLDEANPLASWVDDSSIEVQATSRLQAERPTLAARLLRAHILDMWHARGIRESNDTLFFPLDLPDQQRKEVGPNGNSRQVAKAVFHQKDTGYAKTGDLNFVFHNAVQYGIRTYWKTAFLELFPTPHYTEDGTKSIMGEAASRVHRSFFKGEFNRDNSQRISWIRFWHHALFDRGHYETRPEPWYDLFQVGPLEQHSVTWSPMATPRQQTVLEVE